MAEQSMRQALTISMGDWSTFVTRPISASLLSVAVLMMVAPRLYRLWRKAG
jgi:putative tricarboxylic transport membrane protein